jgi:hypothetical protein
MRSHNGLRKTPQEIIDAVQEDSDLTPEEKETQFRFVKADDKIRAYTEEAGIMRRLLKHPEFVANEFRVTTVDAWGRKVSPDEYSDGRITGVKGYLPIGTLKVLARSRSTSGHATVVSKEAMSISDE